MFENMMDDGGQTPRNQGLLDSCLKTKPLRVLPIKNEATLAEVAKQELPF